MPGPQVKMVRIRQNDLRPLAPGTDLLQKTLRHGLHTSRRPDRHKDRRLHHPMRQRQSSPAASTLRRRLNLE